MGERGVAYRGRDNSLVYKSHIIYLRLRVVGGGWTPKFWFLGPKEYFLKTFSNSLTYYDSFIENVKRFYCLIPHLVL